MGSMKRAKEVRDYTKDNDTKMAMDNFGISRETVRRYCRMANNEGKGNEKLPEPNAVIWKKLTDRLTLAEIKAFANGVTLNPNEGEQPIIDFDCEEVTIGYCTDTHIGSIDFKDYLWESFLAECDKQQVSMILHSGDLIEGMSNRPDQVYNLEDIGYSAQMDHAERLISMTDLPIYIVDGNHDRWGIKSGGIFVVKDLAGRIPNLHFIGHDNGDIIINNTKWRLWHGEDGSSYATSYRVQKVIESLPTDNKPDVLLCGHTHKMVSLYTRGVNAVSGGALSFQSSWMRSKKLECHTGFYILKAGIKDGKIIYMEPRWYPLHKI